jgi:nitric oxide reductase subunit B
MIGMTGAFAVAGITQVYLERRMGMDFLQAQKAVQVHFGGVVLAASLLTFGIALFVWNFVQYGLPNVEAVGADEIGGAAETV